MQTCTCYNLIPNFYHGLIQGLGITSQLKFTVLMNIRKSGQHICAWDSNLVKHQPAIILLLIPKLGTDITNFYSRERKVRFSVSDGYQKSLDAVLFTADVALCKYDRMVCPKA